MPLVNVTEDRLGLDSINSLKDVSVLGVTF